MVHSAVVRMWPTHSTMDALMKFAKTCPCSDGRPELNLDEDKGVSFTSTSVGKERLQSSSWEAWLLPHRRRDTYKYKFMELLL